MTSDSYERFQVSRKMSSLLCNDMRNILENKQPFFGKWNDTMFEACGRKNFCFVYPATDFKPNTWPWEKTIKILSNDF